MFYGLYPGFEDSLCSSALDMPLDFPKLLFFSSTSCLKFSNSPLYIGERLLEYSGAVSLGPSQNFHFNLSLSKPILGVQSFIH